MIKKLSFLLLTISFLLFIISITVFYVNTKPLDKYEFLASVNVTSDRMGFDVNGSALTFGNVIKGGSSTRNLVLDNGYDFPIVLNIKASGEIKKFLVFEEDLKVEKQGSIDIPFTVMLPENSALGYYGGNIIVEIRRYG